MKNTKLLSDLYKQYQTSPEGLKTAEVTKRREQYGWNKLPEEKIPSIIIMFLKQFADPLIYVLLFAAIMSFMIGERVDSYFIFGVLFFNATIGTIQEYSANKSALSLKQMVEAKTFVIRNGYEQEISAADLVPGDIVVLKTGNKIPADLILTDTDNLQIDESMLTGESVPITKNCDFVPQKDAAIQDKKNEAFAGTIITRGIGRGIVKATALQTEIGKIANKITQGSENKPPLMIRMEKFSLNLTVIMVFSILIIAGVALHRGTSLHETFLLATGLAVAAIPEGLPIAITVTLAVGMNRMAKRNVIVRNLVAVESLGSCTAIASDKTGTLTINELTVTEILLPNDKGISTVEKAKNLLPISQEHSFKKLSAEKKIAIASVLPNEATEHNGEFFGDPVDIAFLKLAIYKGYAVNEIHKKYDKVRLIPYSSEIRYSASFNIVDQFVYAFVKGAPEVVLAMCDETKEQQKKIKQQMDEMAKCGLKVLSVACGKTTNGKKTDYSEKDLKGLEFLGLIGMIDPLRPEVKDAVKECQKAGIKVIMVTGDNPKTAYAIARDLDFIKSQNEVVTGYDLKAVAKNPHKLDELTRKASVYARVEPIQKLDIVQSLSRNGNFVAVTGDGVNDAPALKNASVGVAMGKNGTDIARESSDIIITDDNFASIVNGIKEGRVAYANIRKLIFLLISTGIAEIGVFIVTMLLNLPIPFFAAQLLWLNLVTEGIQDVSLALEKEEGDEMEKKPRHPDEPIFDKLMIGRIIISAIVMTAGISGLFYFLLTTMAWETEKARNAIIMLFVLFENMQVLNSRSEHHSIFKQSFKKNPYLLIGIALATLTHIMATYTPMFSKTLKIKPLSFEEWKFTLPIALTILVVMEIEKIIRKLVKKKR